jgi:hypothetical protein
MIIKNKQLEILNALSMEKFEHKMLDYLRDSYHEGPGEFDIQENKDLIREGMSAAKKFDIDHERGIAKFIDLMMREGKDFYVSEKWRPILEDGTLFPEDRLDKITDMADKPTQ